MVIFIRLVEVVSRGLLIEYMDDYIKIGKIYGNL